MGVAFGPLRPFAALCRCAHSKLRARDPLAGHPCGQRARAINAVQARARTPRMGPPPVPRTPAPAPAATPLVAGHRAAAVVVPPAEAHSRCPWLFARLDRDDAAGRVVPPERGPENGGAATVAQSVGGWPCADRRALLAISTTCPRAQAGMRAPANGRKGPTADSNSSELPNPASGVGVPEETLLLAATGQVGREREIQATQSPGATAGRSA